MTDHSAAKKHIYLKVHDDRAEGYLDPIPSSLVEVIEWLQKKLESVPEEYRDQVYFDLSVDPNYSRPLVEIAYSRFETDAEFKVRRAKEKTQKEVEEEKEIKLLLALKEKYPEFDSHDQAMDSTVSGSDSVESQCGL